MQSTSDENKPKTLNSSSTIVEITAYRAGCIFNEGTLVLLIVMNSLGINCGSTVYRHADKTDSDRITVVIKYVDEIIRESRMQHR